MIHFVRLFAYETSVIAEGMWDWFKGLLGHPRA